jgi:DNA-binding MarR family transcriptional regulator
MEAFIDEAIDQMGFRDLTRQQLHYLRIISRLQNPSISELAKELRLTKPTVTVLIEKLVEKGYVRKVQSDADRRFSHLHIAEKGEEVHAVFNIAALTAEREIQTFLTKTEQEIFKSILSKIVREYEQKIKTEKGIIHKKIMETL